MGSHNRRLSALIREVESRVADASSKPALLAQAQKLCDFGDKLEFDQHIPWTMIGVGMLLLTVFVCLHLLHSTFGITDNAEIGLFVFSLALPIIGASIMLHRRTRLSSLARAMVEKCMLLDYGMTPQGNLEQKLSNFEAQYTDFCRGNYSRDLRQCIAGTYQGEQFRFAYWYTHLHYVDKIEREVTYRDNEGSLRTRTETSYKHYNRYYLLLAFPWVKGVSLTADPAHRIRMPITSDTADHEFNKRFLLTGMTEMACARFAIPVTVLLMPKFCEILKNPNFTFSEQGELCLSFNNHDFLASNIKADVRTTRAFYKALESGTRLRQFDAAMALLHQLLDQHDNNFRDIS